MAKHHIKDSRRDFEGLSRRGLLAALPAIGASVAIPALARAEGASPMRAIYDRWLNALAACNASPYPDHSPRYLVLSRRLAMIEDAAAAFVPATAEDFALKLIMADAGDDAHQRALLDMARHVAAVS